MLTTVTRIFCVPEGSGLEVFRSSVVLRDGDRVGRVGLSLGKLCSSSSSPLGGLETLLVRVRRLIGALVFELGLLL